MEVSGELFFRRSSFWAFRRRFFWTSLRITNVWSSWPFLNEIRPHTWAKRGIDDDIYSFKALCKPFAGQIIDNKTQQPLSEAMVVLFYDNRAIDVFKTDADGSFSFCLTDDRNYIVQVTKEPYNIFKTDMNSLKTEMAETKKPASIALNKDEIVTYKISGLVYESSTKNSIVGQKISLLEMNGEKIEDVLTKQNNILIKILETQMKILERLK